MNKEELKQKFRLSDAQMEEISEETLEQISGGTYQELVEMAIWLWSRGYGSFLSVDEGNVKNFNVEKMKEFFASKGYRYEPGLDEETQDLYWKDGFPYGSDYIMDLVENGQL